MLGPRGEPAVHSRPRRDPGDIFIFGETFIALATSFADARAGAKHSAL